MVLIVQKRIVNLNLYVELKVLTPGPRDIYLLYTPPLHPSPASRGGDGGGVHQKNIIFQVLYFPSRQMQNK